jgi:nitroreductase
MIILDKLDVLYDRKSVRKFKDEPVAEDDLKEILNGALNAPSAVNCQNWHFVVIRNKEKIKKIKTIVMDKYEDIIEKLETQALIDRFNKKIKYYTFFDQAPVLILVFASEYKSKTPAILKESGYGQDIELFEKADPSIQDIGAAMQNLQLNATYHGYGTTWMTGPNFAIREIENYLAFDLDGYHMVAMSPLGVPTDGQHFTPKKKGIEEKVTFID